MQVSFEKLVELIISEVINELAKQCIKIDFSKRYYPEIESDKKVKSYEVDMSKYKTPVLTENHINDISSEVVEILIPAKTILTPGAKELIKKKGLTINHKTI